MAISKCSKCNNTAFEMVEKEIIGANFKIMFIQCNRCGAVVGVQDYYNLGAMLNTIKKHLGIPLQ
jgi:translation initiation factor 2 beta subunit (eIF-2beta)/eIF-5